MKRNKKTGNHISLETTITQKPCIHKSMSFEGQQQRRIEHNGSRMKLHGEDYEQGKKRVDNYKHVASALKKREL